MASHPNGLSTVTGSRRSDTAFHQIATRIHDGQFAPGERLPAERELAEKLKVSRPTLRDALNRLEARGYVDRRTGSGNYVCTSVPAAIRTPLEEAVHEKIITLQQIIDVRKPLEVWASREAASQRTGEQLAELQDVLASMCAAGRKSDAANTTAYAQSDICFHLTIAKMTRNPVYLHTLHFLTDLISQSLQISRELLDEEFAEENNAKHTTICEAIAAGRPDEAAKAMADHFALIESRICRST